jgi:protein MAK16|tara:strand:+ start:4466 stop:5083 length:618 start_codon:yes stop_codon:yes gene_type:complete
MKTTMGLGETFCRNKYSVTGLCNRQSCPLANSKYATVVEEAGTAYLCMKTVERAHTPSKMWHRVPLEKNYAKALKQVDGMLTHWSKFLVHKSKQRLTKITQFLMRTRKLLKEKRPKIVTMPAKQIKREARRESKAHVAAQLENSIEKELLERLKAGTYDNHHSHNLGKYEGLIAPAKAESKKKAQKRQHVEIEYEDGTVAKRLAK